MGPTTRSATCSGADMPKRLGNRSASKMNKLVTMTNDTTAAAVLAWLSLSGNAASSGCSKGAKAPSPTTPPRMATVFTPIWMAVKKSPGSSCTANTLAARASPCSSIWRSRRRREAATDNSAIAKKALAAIRAAMSNRLLNVSMRSSVASLPGSRHDITAATPRQRGCRVATSPATRRPTAQPAPRPGSRRARGPRGPNP